MSEATKLRWFTSGSGRIEFQLTLDQAEAMSHSGRCDDDVAEGRKVPEIAAQLAKIDPEVLRSELREYGAWDDLELSDHESNLDRILWLAAGDIRDRQFEDWD